jgi:hypothetical protein
LLTTLFINFCVSPLNLLSKSILEVVGQYKYKYLFTMGECQRQGLITF